MGGLTAEVYDILYQSTIAEADPGEGSPPPPQLFVDQTEARGGRNNNFGDQAPRLSQGLDDRVPSRSRSRTA